MYKKHQKNIHEEDKNILLNVIYNLICICNLMIIGLILNIFFCRGIIRIKTKFVIEKKLFEKDL